MNVLRRILTFMVFLGLTACLDRIDIGVQSDSQSQIVVDGFISDEQGPYTVRLTRTQGIEADLAHAKPFSAQRVNISDDIGNSQDLEETELGVYQTKPFGTFRGAVGRSYTLRIEARDGSIYESSPERMEPAGKIDTIYYQLISSHTSSGLPEYGFNIYINSRVGEAGDNYLRWKFTGTYKVETFPDLHVRHVGESIVPDPLPCCGACWLTQGERSANVSDNQIVSNGEFKNIQVGYVPINGRTFFEKYKVEVRQMSLSVQAFDYWKTVQAQHDGVGSLFQPPLGQPKTNIATLKGANQVQGIFYASSITSKVLFLTPKDIPFSIPPALKILDDCRTLESATIQQPSDWK